MLRRPELLQPVHPKLAMVIRAVSEVWDLVLLESERSKEKEEENIRTGKSHLTDPMRCLHLKQADGYVHAVDLAFDPINWKDTRRFFYLGGYIRATALAMGVTIRWGGDWDSDTDENDQTFFDLVHFELPL